MKLSLSSEDHDCNIKSPGQILTADWLSVLLSVSLSVQRLILVVQFVNHSESLQELGEVDAAVLVEVDASCQVVDGSVVDVHAQVSAEETPGVTKLLGGDETWRTQVTLRGDEDI